MPVALARVGIDTLVEEFTVQPGIQGTLVECEWFHEALQHDIARVSEDDLAAGGLRARKPSFVHQVMMVPAQQYEVLQAGLAAVCPMDDVMAIHESIVVAAREPASTVSEH